VTVKYDPDGTVSRLYGALRGVPWIVIRNARGTLNADSSSGTFSGRDAVGGGEVAGIFSCRPWDANGHPGNGPYDRRPPAHARSEHDTERFRQHHVMLNMRLRAPYPTGVDQRYLVDHGRGPTEDEIRKAMAEYPADLPTTR
jgi:hypothetical protein